MKMINNPKITLGMPVLNGEKHISFALDSIFKQNFKNFNLIIYDNASTDKTLLISKGYQQQHKNIIIYKQIRRVNSIKNWISVLKKTVSKYILFCGHDDVFKEKEYLQNLINKISSNIIPFPKINIIDEKNYLVNHICNNKVLDFNGPAVYRRLKFFFTPSIFGKNNFLYGIHETRHLLKSFQILDKIKNFNHNYLDNYLNYEILKKKKVYQVNNSTFLKRIKNSANKHYIFGFKNNKIKILLNHVKILLDYTKFSSFLESIIIILLIPMHVAYERISLFNFKISNLNKKFKKKLLIGVYFFR
jgi:glycosyltransferase involved in cell wall biosynthesis